MVFPVQIKVLLVEPMQEVVAPVVRAVPFWTENGVTAKPATLYSVTFTSVMEPGPHIPGVQLTICEAPARILNETLLQGLVLPPM